MTLHEKVASAFPYRIPRLHPPTCLCSDCQLIARIMAAVESELKSLQVSLDVMRDSRDRWRDG
jgi:hypothetical protein